MRNASPRDRFIFVGDDVNHLGFRFMATGIFVDDKWMDFLGGFFIQQKENELLVYHRGEQYQLPKPYWWD